MTRLLFAVVLLLTGPPTVYLSGYMSDKLTARGQKEAPLKILILRYKFSTSHLQLRWLSNRFHETSCPICLIASLPRPHSLINFRS